MSPLLAALDVARKNPVTLPIDCYPTPGYTLFIGVAYHAQRIAGTDNTELPCKALARLMGKNALLISSYRKRAVQDGFLAPKVTGRETQYQVIVDKFIPLPLAGTDPDDN